MKKEKEYMTATWSLYERGQNFKNTRDLFRMVKQAHEMESGNQWAGLNPGVIRPITLNILKSLVKFKIGVVNANDYEIIYTPNNIDNDKFNEELRKITKHLNRYIRETLETFNIYRNIRKVVKDACIVGEGVLYFDYNKDKTEVYSRVIPMVNISYGNENDSDIQEQPYILLSFRKPVDQVREEAIANGIEEETAATIHGTKVSFEESGIASELEVNDMVTVVYKFFKKEGTVWCEKTVKSLVFKEAFDTELTLYPITHYNWEDVEGSARGIGVVQYNIPNQIEINKTATRRALAVMLTAYPKLVYNGQKIKDIKALTEVGTPIKLTGDGASITDVRQAIGYLNPATASADASNLQSELMDRTRELEGAGDSVTGEVNPEQASGKAILAVQQAARQPLKEQIDKLKIMYEEIGNIVVDFWKTHSSNGKTITEYVQQQMPDGTVQEVPKPFKIKRSVLNKMKLNTKVDITPKTPFDKLAQEMALEKFLGEKTISFEEYVKALEENASVPVKKLQQILDDRAEKKKQIMDQQKQMNQMKLAMEQGLNIRSNEIQSAGGMSPEELGAANAMQ